MNAPQNVSPRRRLQELQSIPERDRTEAEWDELHELEISLAPGNRADGAPREQRQAPGPGPKQGKPNRPRPPENREPREPRGEPREPRGEPGVPREPREGGGEAREGRSKTFRKRHKKPQAAPPKPESES
jgi:hypothetical protein